MSQHGPTLDQLKAKTGPFTGAHATSVASKLPKCRNEENNVGLEVVALRLEGITIRVEASAISGY